MTNIEEQLLGLNPGRKDSDDDGYADGGDLPAIPMTGELNVSSPYYSSSPVQTNGCVELAAAGDTVAYRGWRVTTAGTVSTMTDVLALTGNMTI